MAIFASPYQYNGPFSGASSRSLRDWIPDSNHVSATPSLACGAVRQGIDPTFALTA
jgi:hypothetical protein